PSAPDVAEQVALGAVRHERQSYFSCSSLDALIRRHGLFLNDVEYLADDVVGAFRCLLGPREAVSEQCEARLRRERLSGVTELDYYDEFQRRAHSMLCELADLLRSLRARGHSIVAYGTAPASVTLLNASGIGCELIDFVVETDPQVH